VKIDDSLLDAIIYDWYVKNSFIDHISDNNFNTDNFRHCNFHEFGDFANQGFELELSKKKAIFSRNGGMYFPHKVNTSLTKSYTPKQNGFDFEIELSSEAEGKFNYVLEHNFHFSDYELLSINGTDLQEEDCIKATQTLEIVDKHLNKKILIHLDRPFDLHYFQLKTLSQSEEGFDLSVQGVSFAMSVPFSEQLHIKGNLEIVDV